VNNVVFIQARMGSKRLPGKTLKNLTGKPMIWHVIERLNLVLGIEKVVVLTSNLPADDVLAQWCKKNDVECFRGSEENVLQRYFDAAQQYSADNILRATGDNPFVDYRAASQLMKAHSELGAEYSSNKSEIFSTLPDGLGVEIFSFSALKRSVEMSTQPHHFEHVNEYILENRKQFRIYKDSMAGGLHENSDIRLTVDTLEDFKKAEFITSSNFYNIEVTLKELLKLEADYIN